MHWKKILRKYSIFEKEKVIIITGASSGIGKHVALALSSYRVKLTIVARREKKLKRTARELKRLKIPVLAIVGDVRNREDREKIIEQTLSKFGKIDVLINNAGLGKASLFINQPEYDIEELIETNILSLIKMSQLIIPVMKEQNDGHIINLSSTLALLPAYPFAVYCATKSAVKTFSDCIREEVQNYGIKVSTILPGPYNTEFHKVAGIDDSSYLSYSVEKLSKKIAKLVFKPKENMIQPWFFGILLWITTRFNFIKNAISVSISKSIVKGIKEQPKLVIQQDMFEEKEIKVRQPKARK